MARMKASDYFRKSTTFLGKTSSLAETFPDIEDASVEIETNEHNGSRVAHYRIGTIGEYVDCPNPQCSGGGLRIVQILRLMVLCKETEREQTRKCIGHVGRGRTKRDCDVIFKIHARITYKQPWYSPLRDISC
jgi:hypothetical protein